MDASQVVLVVVVAVVAIALIAMVARMATTKKQERDRAQAGELRERAAQQATEVERRAALAKETEAQAAAARAEADRKVAEAERLEAESRERAETAARHREEHQEHLKQADELDPDVKHAAPTTAPEGDTGATPTDGEPWTRRESPAHRAETAEEPVSPDGTTAGDHPDAARHRGTDDRGTDTSDLHGERAEETTEDTTGAHRA